MLFASIIVNKGFPIGLIKKESREDIMSREWTVENDININNKTMEGMLIEVFGCMSLGSSVINLDAKKDSKRIESEFYLDGNTMEGMLIEVFGCMSLSDSVITLDATRDRKRVKHEALRFPAMLEEATLSAQLA
jgi:hypothetical protein